MFNQNDSQQEGLPSFDPAELDTFMKLLDVEGSGIINIADLEESLSMLGLEGFYASILD
jgi:hypothetical protein